MLGSRSGWDMSDVYKTVKDFRRVARLKPEPEEKTFVEDLWDDRRTWFDNDIWGV